MSWPSEQPPTVLVVEDEFLQRLLMTETLRDAGFVILEAADAPAALGQLAEHDEVSVLVTDINMPGKMDGIELAKLVRKDRPCVHTLLTSGKVWPREDELEDGLFLPKPYAMASLVAAVRQLAQAEASGNVSSPAAGRSGRGDRPGRRTSPPGPWRA